MGIIKVLDRLPGTGKTTYIINKLKDENRKFVYVTPLLSEVDRICAEIPNTSSPYGWKSLKFKQMIQDGKSIATTHSLFLSLSDTKVPSGYTLVVDEALNCIEQYSVSRGRFREMFEGGTLVADKETGLINFVADIEEYNKETDLDTLVVYAACINKCAYLVDDTIIIVELSPNIIRQFEDVYILTFSFENSVFANWLSYHKMHYQYINPVLSKTDQEVKSNLRSLINFVEHRGVNKLGYGYSYTDWVKNIHTNVLKKKLVSYFTHSDAKAGDILVTCPKDYWKKVKGKGYSNSTWIASRTKASNLYRDKTFVVYLYNKYYNPHIKRFCNERGIPLNDDAYAVSELIQFIFRSALRDNKPIRLLLPSKRMRKLLEEFLVS